MILEIVALIIVVQAGGHSSNGQPIASLLRPPATSCVRQLSALASKTNLASATPFVAALRQAAKLEPQIIKAIEDRDDGALLELDNAAIRHSFAILEAAEAVLQEDGHVHFRRQEVRPSFASASDDGSESDADTHNYFQIVFDPDQGNSPLNQEAKRLRSRYGVHLAYNPKRLLSSVATGLFDQSIGGLMISHAELLARRPGSVTSHEEAHAAVFASQRNGITNPFLTKFEGAKDFPSYATDYGQMLRFDELLAYREELIHLGHELRNAIQTENNDPDLMKTIFVEAANAAFSLKEIYRIATEGVHKPISKLATTLSDELQKGFWTLNRDSLAPNRLVISEASFERLPLLQRLRSYSRRVSLHASQIEGRDVIKVTISPAAATGRTTFFLFGDSAAFKEMTEKMGARQNLSADDVLLHPEFRRLMRLSFQSLNQWFEIGAQMQSVWRDILQIVRPLTTEDGLNLPSRDKQMTLLSALDRAADVTSSEIEAILNPPPSIPLR